MRLVAQKRHAVIEWKLKERVDLIFLVDDLMVYFFVLKTLS